MTTGIFYFSGTGNTLKAAKDLAAKLKDAEIISIAKVLKTPVNKGFDKIGIVFPVYMWGLPLIVADFLNKLNAPQKYVFAVSTYGGFQGGALEQVKSILDSKGIKLSAGFGIRMPGNYTPMYGAIPENKQRKYFTKASEKIKDIAEIVNLGKENKIEKNAAIVNWLFSKKFYNFAAPHIKEMDKSFWTDEKCNSCGVCVRVCPVANIVLVSGKPQWRHNCEQCMACLQWCPECAIQSGKNTSGKKRYRHPEAEVNDFYRE